MEEEECGVYTRACVEAKSLGVDEFKEDCNRVVRNFDPKLVVQTVLLIKPAGPELGGQCIVNMTFSPLPWAPVAEAREHLSALGALP